VTFARWLDDRDLSLILFAIAGSFVREPEGARGDVEQIEFLCE
jgi:hypothetical protein